MYEVSVRGGFAAAHYLRGYGGKCEHLHGHNWEVELTLESSDLGPLGIVVDFKEVKELLLGILEELDHQELNTLQQFLDQNPSSENIARWIFEEFSERMGWRGVILKHVDVWESPGSRVSYRK